MQVHIDDKEVTQNSMNLGISIDENQTDARLLAILDKVEVVIYDKGKNVADADNEESTVNGNNSDDQSGNSDSENNNTQQEIEIKRITFTKDQVQALKISEEVELNLEQLNSNTIYRIDAITTVKQGTVETIVEDKQNLEQLITLKMPAEVQVRNQFVIGTMIDLDIRIEDIDNAVLTNQVRIEVRDKDNKLIDLSEMPTNAEYERKTYEDLTPNETYRIIVYAPQYNIGSTDATYKADYILKEIKIVTETGISGKLDLIGLEKTPTGKNLIDVSSKVNWYEKCFGMTLNSGDTYGLNYDENNKILYLGGTGNYLKRTYYNLSDYLGHEITMSFRAKSTDNTQIHIVEKNSDDANEVGYSSYLTVSDLNSEWEEYRCTFTLSKTGYVGFVIVSNKAMVEIQDLQAELGNRKTDYEQFQYDYNANVSITVNDARDEITTNDYYIRIYKNNEQIQELRYEEIGEDNKVENVQKTYNIEQDANYKIELLVKISDRYFELDTQEFSTEGARELKGISNINDFLKIQPYGEYIVLNDLDYSDSKGSQYKFGISTLQFNGKIDFNGKQFIKAWESDSNPTVFSYIGNDGVLENLVLSCKLNPTSPITSSHPLVSWNNGTIKNIRINVVESSSDYEIDQGYLVCSGNYGLIENFVIDFVEPFYISGVGGVFGYENYGTIKNGYMYGENIKFINQSPTSNSRLGGIICDNLLNGVIENVYSLVEIDSEALNTGDLKGMFVYRNKDNATVQNVYSVGIGENTDLTKGPNIYTKESKKIYNNYYFADEIFTSELETKGNKLSLWDSQFQNQVINSEGAFIVDELVNEGYFPWIDMPDVMPAQDYIELPEVEDADLPDILSTKVLEQGTDTVKVQFNVNNPSSAQISNIEIQNLDVEILSQEYSNGQSMVIAELMNPVICISSYDVLSISISGAFGSTYTRPYEEGERIINVDLYNEIWSVNDWKAINDSPIENYMLMTDLDFINEENTVNISNIDGIINGNEHSISNVNLTANTSLITTLGGSLTNIFINNFSQEVTWRGGLIYLGGVGSIVDNVHLTNVHITKTGIYNVGGLIQHSTSNSITNCSINQVRITTEGSQESLRIGGMIGNADDVKMRNCFVSNLYVEDTRGINTGVGGLIGAGDGAVSITNCYATGTINSENINVGGLIGSATELTLENCYSKVNISTINSNVGGVVGLYGGSELNNIKNNLAIGNIYTTSGLDSLNRIIGNYIDTSSYNYAYVNQLLNGYASNEEKGATLLSAEEILNLDLGDSYNYEDKDKGILPKLYNTEGTELLPNQTDILVDDNADEEIAELEVESVEASKPNTTEAEITVRINNPEEIEITGIEIEDMTITSVVRSATQNGITSITVRSTPNRYYDSYKLIGIKYKSDMVNEEEIKQVEVGIDVQFYKEIYTYEDWQTIEEGTYQNYRLMADIDFTGKDNVKNNITVNRLEAENNTYTLKNIELTYNTANAGLLNNIKTSIKNIGFENITLTNTASSGNYFGIIASNNGDIENVSFKNITVNATNLGDVGLIGGMTSGNIHDIEMDTINIEGYGYVGGLIGIVDIDSNAEINNINANNITVINKYSFTGGIIGRQYGNYMEIHDIVVNDSNISGQRYYAAGIVGVGTYSSYTNLEVNNTNVSGHYGVGGAIGYINSSENINERLYIQINSCNITGTGNNIGGVGGFFTGGNNRYWTVRDTTINGSDTSSQNVGGLLGTLDLSMIYDFQVIDTTINSAGNYVGGATGYNNSRTYLVWGNITNTQIEGNSYVGGITGYASWSYIYRLYVNADINASSDTAGGIVGYMYNEYMSATRNAIRISNLMVVDSSVEAPTKAGGLIGDIAGNIYREQSFYFDNLIDADVTSTNTSTGSLIIGGRPDENPYIENTYVYRYSTLNGNYVYATNDNIDDNQYLVRTDLEQQNTYTNRIGLESGYWNYESLSEGKYPKIVDGYLYKPELQTGVDLPTDPGISSINSLSVGDENDDNNANGTGANANNIADENGISTQSVEALPSYKVYPTKVDEINIDFSDIPEGVSFTYYVNGKNVKSGSEISEQTGSGEANSNDKKETIDLEQKTYTFKYNYQSTLEIKLTNGQDEKTITINPEDVRSEASLVGNNNAYLLGTSLYINGELQQGEYVNVYYGYALNSTGQILDIATKQLTSENVNKNSTDANAINENSDNEAGAEITDEVASSEVVTTTLQQTATPLHTYNYNGSTIETYGTYSTVNGNIKQQIYNVRSGELSALSNSLDMKIDNYIVDNYNNKEYQTILTTEGQVEDLKEILQYPDNFLSSNIKQIVQNADVEKTEMIVLYNTGKVIVFDYVTGNVIYENDEKADEGLVGYLTRSFANIWNDYEDRWQEYAKSKELEAKLAKLPVLEAIQKASNNSGTNAISNSLAGSTNINQNDNDTNSISANNTNNASGNPNSTTDNSYITVYNADTGEYEVYSEDEILNGEDENPVSETTKIKENGLESVYNYETNEESKPQANGAVIVVSIIAVAIIALIVLRKVVIKNNIKKQTK